MKPAKGKKFVKKVNGRKVSYGAKEYRIGTPGSEKANNYCARSAGIARKHPSARKASSPNALSRKKWNCRGSKSIRKKTS